MIKVILSSYNMGDVSEADFDAWAAYVAARIDGVVGFSCDVDQQDFGATGNDKISDDSAASRDGDQRCEAVGEALRSLWEDFCADASAWPVTAVGCRPT